MAVTVAVVGGGIIGSSIAWRLAAQGARITIFDAGTMGGEASWAGAGMLAPGGEVDSASGWRGMAAESAAMYPDFVRELEAASGVKIDYRACGALELARTEEEVAALEAKAALQKGLGIASQPVPLGEARELVPAAALDGFAAARYYPGDGMVNPREIMAALRVILPALGAVIRENEPRKTVRASDGYVEVDGQPFDAAILAAGAWASTIDTGAPLAEAFPVRGHLTGYWLEPGFLGPLLRHDHTYLLQRSNGFLIAGASQEDAGFRRDIDPAIVATLGHRAHELLPGLRGRTPDEVWTGFRPAAAGYEPQLGRYADTNLWLAYGHYRNGILLAPITARRIATAVSASLGIG